MRIVARYLLFAAIATTGCRQQTPTAGDFAAQRQRMVEQQLKPRGIKDERVLAAMAQGAARGVHSRGCASRRVRRWAAAHRLRSDHFPAIHRGVHDGTTATETERPRVRNRERLGLSGGNFSRARGRRLHDRNRRTAGENCAKRRFNAWATRTCISRSATVTKAGPKRRRSMRSS